MIDALTQRSATLNFISACYDQDLRLREMIVDGISRL